MKILDFIQNLADFPACQRKKLRRFYQKVKYGPYGLLRAGIIRIQLGQIVIFMLSLDYVLRIGGAEREKAENGLQLLFRNRK